MYNAPAVGDHMNIQSQAPEPIPANKEEDKEVVPLVEEKQINSRQFCSPTYYNATEPAQTSQRESKSRILGFRPTTIWLLLLLAILLVAGAIGGGVGGSFVSKDSSKHSSKCDSLDPIFIWLMIDRPKSGPHYGIHRVFNGLAKRRSHNQSAYHTSSSFQYRFPSAFGDVADPKDFNQSIPGGARPICQFNFVRNSNCVRLHRLPSLELHPLYFAWPELHACMRPRMV